MKKTNRKQIQFKLFAAALAFVALLSFAPISAQTNKAYADGAFNEFIETIEIAQSQFDLGNLTSMPASPSSWTNNYSAGETGGVISGVLTLNQAYISNHEKTKLGIYDEYKDKTNIPITPFGRTVSNPQSGEYHANTNKNVLMINTNKTWAAFGYSSSDITLAANSFYAFSAWTKTGGFSANEGAAITLTGLKNPTGIWNINTVADIPLKNGIPDLDERNNWGWKKYTIYLATGADSETVKLKLSVGDNVEDHRFLSNGYAFFDNINLVKLSPTNFYKMAVENDTSVIYDNNSDEFITSAATGTDIGSFSYNTTGWSIISDEESGTKGTIDFNTYNASAPFIDNRSFGFTSEPFSPRGKAESFNNILVLSSYQKNKDSFNNVQAGVKSSDIKIEKETNYKLSVWYNTQQISGSASIVISGESTQFSTQYKITPVEAGELTTDSNKERYGWQKKDILIKGSVLKDVLINVELWLGYSSSASGIAMFDDITLTKITSKEYNELSATGTQVIIDSGETAAINVSNGFFNQIDYADQDELKNTYPLTPTSWKFLDAATANWTGFSRRDVKYDDAIYGVVPTNNAHFNQNASNYGSIPNPYQHEIYGNKNVLLMNSPTPTTIGYRSDSIIIAANSFNVITIKMLVDASGAGANLVLKNGDRVISTIENITSTSNAFRTYQFYVSGSGAEVNLTVEMWLGMPDRDINISKQASGYMIVDSVIMETVDEAILKEKAEEFTSISNMRHRYTDFAVYRLGSFDFSAYDRYSDAAIKDAYDFTSTNTGLFKSGIIGLLPSNQSDVPSFFGDANSQVEGRFNTALYLQNIESGYSKLTSLNTFGLEADSCYKIEFSMLVDLSANPNEDAIGAGVWLGSTAITDIRNTLDDGIVVGSENGELIREYKPAFNTFTFFYATSDEAETVEWSISLGANAYPNERISGTVIVNKITVTKTDTYYFDEDLEKLLAANEDAEEINDIFGYKLIDRRVTAPVDETIDEEIESTVPATGANSPWFLVPSVLFGVAILVALFGVVIKKFMGRRGGKRPARVVSYDRNVADVPTKRDDDQETDDVSDIFQTNRAQANVDSFDDKLIEEKKEPKRNIKQTSEPIEPVDESKSEPIEPVEITIDEFEE